MLNHTVATTAADNLPRNAMNLARRIRQIAGQGNGRYIIELVVIDGRWLLVVQQVQKIEDLGQD